jgi:hypothetical protein
LTALAFFGLLTDISTTLSELDWIIVSTIYLTISLVLVWTQFQKNKILKIIGIIAIIIVFGIGYLFGTIGVIGVGFIVGECTVDYEKRLENGIIYKESRLGNAISNHRGKKVEIYKTIPWFPIIEWKILSKEYYCYFSFPTNNNYEVIDFDVVTAIPTIEYKSTENRIYLSVSKWSEREKKQINWADTLTIK